MTDLSDFVLARLADDERRLAAGELPLIDEAERRGRIRVMRTDDGAGILVASVYDTHPDWREDWRR